MVGWNTWVFLSERLHLKTNGCFSYVVVSTELVPVYKQCPRCHPRVGLVEVGPGQGYLLPQPVPVQVGRRCYTW
jgi:hypothetical protein